jgi:hypothetical protein
MEHQKTHFSQTRREMGHPRCSVGCGPSVPQAIGPTVTVMRPALTIIAALIEPRGVGFCRLLVLRLRYSNREAVMAAGFLKQLFEIFCRHRFSWPHSSVHGPDYQICLICGTTYEYDCVTMRRTRRLASVLHERAELKSDAGHGD